MNTPTFQQVTFEDAVVTDRSDYNIVNDNFIGWHYTVKFIDQPLLTCHYIFASNADCAKRQAVQNINNYIKKINSKK